MPRNNSFGRKPKPAQSFISRKAFNSPGTLKCSFFHLLWGHADKLKTKIFSHSLVSPNAHATYKANPPAMLATTPTVQEKGEQNIRMACTGGSCMQEYLWNYLSSHKSLINFPWQLRKFIIDWEDTHIFEVSERSTASLQRVKNIRKGSLSHWNHTLLR